MPRGRERQVRASSFLDFPFLLARSGNMANENLTKAKRAKNDEFYTQYADIQKEIEAYLEFDANVFRGKVVYSNCDDPFESNFFRYFVLNFKKLGLKQLITTSYKPSPVANAHPRRPPPPSRPQRSLHPRVLTPDCGCVRRGPAAARGPSLNHRIERRAAAGLRHNRRPPKPRRVPESQSSTP